jgi:hypothetical protein
VVDCVNKLITGLRFKTPERFKASAIKRMALKSLAPKIIKAG